ncbi:AAA family ATPase [Cryomorphaceae bacterium 1068]|nr:AAA family ATPase [Cryomorphaceae bacterium 1068]
MDDKLKEFKIVGLFKSRDVSIPLDGPVKILIGENGLGKTTILNALYYTLTSQFYKLSSLQFDSIEVTLTSGESFVLKNEDLAYITDEDYHDHRTNRLTQIISEVLTEDEKLQLAEAFQSEDRKASRDVFEHYVRELSMRYPSPPHRLRRAISLLFDGNLARFQELSVKLRQSLGHEIIYFPTYRRIEEDLKNLGFDKDIKQSGDNTLIQFGMEDVSKTIGRKLYEIKNATIEGFSTLTGELLNQYVTGDLNLKDNEKIIRPGVLGIILERVGENIRPETKNEIIELVDSGRIFTDSEKHKYLLNFISELIRLYDEQKELDNTIKEFSDVCSKYLRGKRMSYNESKLTLTVIDKKGAVIDLKDLSSGEKQIISIFSRIYLETLNKVIVLFDEPELSLSMEWQKDLLPDILSSRKCELLIAVTHSPFIFDNNLDMLAEDMNKYVKFYE